MLKNAANRPIYDITPFTTLDFPNHLSCIVWLCGCNMRCAYCYNSDIVLQNGNKTIDELLEFLQKRAGLLDGVVLSGGECTIFRDITIICKKIKELGFKVKVDTNGSNPEVLDSLIKQNLIDYVALDFKAPKRVFKEITNSLFYEKTITSLILLIKSGLNFEVRTTIHSDLLDEKAINEIIDILYLNNYKGIYYLQNYLHLEKNLGNLIEQTKPFDKNLLNNKIPIEFRNF